MRLIKLYAICLPFLHVFYFCANKLIIIINRLWILLCGYKHQEYTAHHMSLWACQVLLFYNCHCYGTSNAHDNDYEMNVICARINVISSKARMKLAIEKTYRNLCS